MLKFVFDRLTISLNSPTRVTQHTTEISLKIDSFARSRSQLHQASSPTFDNRVFILSFNVRTLTSF